MPGNWLQTCGHLCVRHERGAEMGAGKGVEVGWGMVAARFHAPTQLGQSQSSCFRVLVVSSGNWNISPAGRRVPDTVVNSSLCACVLGTDAMARVVRWDTALGGCEFMLDYSCHLQAGSGRQYQCSTFLWPAGRSKASSCLRPAGFSQKYWVHQEVPQYTGVIQHAAGACCLLTCPELSQDHRGFLPLPVARVSVALCTLCNWVKNSWPFCCILVRWTNTGIKDVIVLFLLESYSLKCMD